MPPHRFLFYTPDLDADARTVRLDGDENRHATRVLRLEPGDRIRATNGRGLIVAAELSQVSGSGSVAGVTSVEVDERAAPRLALAVALMRKDRLAQALEQCSELGITDFVPFVSERAHVARIGAGAVARLERVAVAAMKQSFRAHLPRVHSPVSFDGLLKYAGSCDHVLVGDQEGRPISAPLPGSTLVVVGPEPGLDERELAALESAGAVLVAVSRHRLRSETACVALVAAAARAIDSPSEPA